MKKGLHKLLCMLMTALLLAGSMATAGMAAEKGFTVRLEGRVQGSEEAEMVNSLLNDSFIELAGSGREDGGILNFEIRFAGNSLLKTLLQFSEAGLAFSFPNLDEHRYEVSGEGIAELLGSVFQTQDGQPVSDILPQFLDGPGFEAGELEEALAPYVSMIGEHLQNNMKIEPDVQVNLEKLGREAQGMLAVYEPDAHQLGAFFEQLADQIDGDEKLAGVVEKLADYIRSLGSLITDSSYYNMYSDISELAGAAENGSESEEEYMEDSRSAADEAADNLTAFFRDLPDVLREAAGSLAQEEEGTSFFRLSLAVPAEEGAVQIPLLIRFAALEGEEETPFFDFESVAIESGRDSCLYFSDGIESVALYHTDTGSAQSKEGTMYVTSSGETLFRAVYNWDLTRRSLLGVPYGTLVVTMNPMMLALTVTDDGTGGSSHKLQLTGMEEMTYDALSGIALDLKTSGEADVEAPSGTVLDISSFSFEELADQFMPLLEKIAENLNIDV